MKDTNHAVSGSGTASDPYTYNFHSTGQSSGAPWLLCLLMVVSGLAVVAAFLPGYYFGKKR